MMTRNLNQLTLKFFQSLSDEELKELCSTLRLKAIIVDEVLYMRKHFQHKHKTEK